VITIPTNVSAFVHMNTSEDMPCDFHAYKHAGEPEESIFTFALGDVTVFMSREQANQLRKALKPSELDRMSDDASIIN